LERFEMAVRRIALVGIPGVGKSTVVNRLVEILQEKGRDVKLVNYGTVMLEQATTLFGVKSRDEMRKLPVESQKKLQTHASSEIARMQNEYVIVDTHLFISTKEGFWPGMPLDVLQALKPTNLVLIVASAEEILKRRQNDKTRTREGVTLELIERELSAATSLLFASSLFSSSPALIVNNPDGPVDPAVERIVKALE
jgi:adenylate kinase